MSDLLKEIQEFLARPWYRKTWVFPTTVIIVAVVGSVMLLVAVSVA